MNAQAIKNLDGLMDTPLPIFWHSDRQFRKLEPDTGSAFKAYGDIILRDPGLAVHAMQQLAPPPGKTSRVEINAMSQVTMLLGAERTRSLTDGLSHVENALRGQARIGYARAACRAFHAAFQAWDWAHIKNDHNPEEILLATLLHDVAELALWVREPEKIHHLRKLIFKDGLHTDEAQYLALGESLEHFSRQLAVSWNLPPLVHEALRPENADTTRTRGIMLAVQLGRAAERGWHSPKMQRTLEQIAEYLGASLEETSSHIRNNAVRAARESAFYDSRPAAALLPLLPGDDHILIEHEFPEPKPQAKTPADTSVIAVKQATEKQAAETVQETATGQGASSRDNHTAEKTPLENTVAEISRQGDNANPAAAICLTPQQDVFTDVARKLQHGLGKMDLNEVMRNTIHGLHDGLGLNRVVFSMLTPERKKLVSRFIIGADNDPDFSRFHIELEKPSLFSKLLEKPVSLWINDENREKYWRLVPQQLKKIISTETFYVMSIFIDNKPIGLFYADRRGPECQLDEDSYTKFRQLCHLAGKSLAASAAKKS